MKKIVKIVLGCIVLIFLMSNDNSIIHQETVIFSEMVDNSVFSKPSPFLISEKDVIYFFQNATETTSSIIHHNYDWFDAYVKGYIYIEGKLVQFTIRQIDIGSLSYEDGSTVWFVLDGFSDMIYTKYYSNKK